MPAKKETPSNDSALAVASILAHKEGEPITDELYGAALNYVTHTNIATAFSMQDAAAIKTMATRFAVAYKLVAKYSNEKAENLRDDDEYGAALKALNAKYPMLEQYRKDLKALNAQFKSGGIPDEATAMLGIYNTIKDHPTFKWPTINPASGEIRKPKGAKTK